MSKILKKEKKINFIIPDLSPVEEEIFKALFSEKLLERKEEIKKEERGRLKEEVFEKAYKMGYNKGYEKGYEKGEKEGFQKGQEEGFKKGYEEGFLKGEKEGKEKYLLFEKKIQAEYQEKIKSIESFLKNLETEIKQLVIHLDKEVLNLTLKIAQKILFKEVSHNSEVTLKVIKEALTYLAEGIEIIIKVNPEEWTYLKEVLAQTSSPSQKIKLVPDENISKGGVFIETAVGVIDATLEKRWERVLNILEKDEN